jgi:PKD repeat protein
MSAKGFFCRRLSVGPVLAAIIVMMVITAAGSDAQQGALYQRRNIFGMHNLKDGGPEFGLGMEYTKHLVGDGFVFDWVFDFEPWIEKAFQLNLIPCIRVQESAGGDYPDPGYAGNVAWSILNYKIAHPEYAQRLVYLQLWNEPNDQRDFVPPDVFADYLVAAHSRVHQAENEAAALYPELGLEGTLKTMTPGQNGPSWWDAAFAHNPDAKFAFDVWGTHPYPEATPPHYNLHDGDVFIETSKTVDSYLMDLDVIAKPHGNPPRSRRGFPVMITETAYGEKLGVSYEGWPKTNRQMAADYNVDAFGERWFKWPEIIAVHPFILSNLSWEKFAWVPWYSSYEDTNGDGIREPTDPYPQYEAVRQLRLNREAQGMAPARLIPYRGPRGTVMGTVLRSDSGDPVPYATLFTDGYEFGHVSLYDGQYEIHDIPAGTYTLSVEKNGYSSAGRQITVSDGQVTTADFNLNFIGGVSAGIYFVDTFAGHSGCNGCDLFADFLGQTFTVPAGVGFIKYAACKPYVDDVTMKFSIHEGGPQGPQVGSSITATLEPGDGAIMIGGEWPDGQEPSVRPGGIYFLKVQRADGQGIYCYASDANPYPDGYAYVGETAHPGWDLYALIRGLTPAQNIATGQITGTVSDAVGSPVAGASVTAGPGGYTANTDGQGHYRLQNLPAGTYSLTVSKTGFAAATQTGVEVVEGDTTSVDVILVQAAPGAIRGTVTDSGGFAIAGALIEISPDAFTVSSAADGGFLVADLAPGTYSLQIDKDGYLPAARSGIKVQSDATAEIEVSLTPVVAATPDIINPDFETDGGFFAVALGWHSFGGNKFESVWDPERIFTQGVADIPPGDVGGVYQKVAVTPGVAYRVTAFGKTTNSGVEVAVGVDPNGGISPNEAAFGSGSTAVVWTQLGVEFTATGPEATIFLLGRNNQTWLNFGWAQFDGLTIEKLTAANHFPQAVLSAHPVTGPAPLQVDFDASGSSDPDGDPLSFAWDFGDGLPPGTGSSISHNFVTIGTYTVVLAVDDGHGATDTSSVTITVGSHSNLVINGDFSLGLTGWTLWTERGTLQTAVDANGQLRLEGTGYNGGFYQQFATAGAGSEIAISGFWASDPTRVGSQWAEVLIINGSRRPLNGQDVHAGQDDVVMIYKNDTWATPGGWSGPMDQTAAVNNTRTFVATGDMATIILKSGNIGGALTGTRYDDLVISGPDI